MKPGQIEFILLLDKSLWYFISASLLALTGITNTLESRRCFDTTSLIMAQSWIHAIDLFNTVESIARIARIAHTFVCIVICGNALGIQSAAVFDIARRWDRSTALQTITFISFWASTILDLLFIVPQANGIVGTKCPTTISSCHAAK